MRNKFQIYLAFLVTFLIQVQLFVGSEILPKIDDLVTIRSSEIKLDERGIMNEISITDTTSNTGGVTVFQSDTKVYQSGTISNRIIRVTGSGFRTGMSVGLEPQLKEGVDYYCFILGSNKMELSLKNGKKWRSNPGFLVVKTIKVSGEVFDIGGVDGIKIANVIADPLVLQRNVSYQETKSSLVTIKGHGFSNVQDTKVTIRPTVPGSYEVASVDDSSILLKLNSGASWIPSFVSLDDPFKRIPLEVMSIDSGAGLITFSAPIAVGFIVKDVEDRTNKPSSSAVLIPPSSSVVGIPPSKPYEPPNTGSDTSVSVTATISNGTNSFGMGLFLAIFFTILWSLLLLYVSMKVRFSKSVSSSSRVGVEKMIPMTTSVTIDKA